MGHAVGLPKKTPTKFDNGNEGGHDGTFASSELQFVPFKYVMCMHLLCMHWLKNPR